MFRAADRAAFFPAPNARTPARPSALNELYDILYAAVQDLAQIVDFQRADPAVVPTAVQSSGADIVFVRQRVRAFAGFSESFPKRGIDNHVRHQLSIWYFGIIFLTIVIIMTIIMEIRYYFYQRGNENEVLHKLRSSNE